MADSRENGQKPDSLSKLDALRNMYTPEIRKDLQDVIKAVDRYKVSRSHDAYSALVVAVLLAASRNAIMFTPVTGLSADKKGMELGSFSSPAGKGYVLCTSPDEAALCPEEIIVLVKSGAIVNTALKDKEYKGIYINPYGKWPCLLQREHMITLVELMKKNGQS